MNEINHSSDMKNDMKRKMHPNSLKNLKPVKKGEIRNPIGKAKGTLDEVTKFKLAIASFEKEQNKDIYKIILEKANRYPQVLIAIFKALVPQQTESNIKIETIYEAYEKLTDQELVNQAHAIIKRTGTFNINQDIN